jgi:hypothetical protein
MEMNDERPEKMRSKDLGNGEVEYLKMGRKRP